MPQSPYIDRLRQAIANAREASVRGYHRAELAACLARHGDFEGSEYEIAELRAEFGDGRSGRVSIMIMCAEAQVIYYKKLGEQARDRMMRAQLLSIAGRDAGLSSLTSAWLAHIAFNLHRHEEMARAAKTCLDTVSREDHEAATRLALTLGDALFAAELSDLGTKWYGKAHQHALKLGDHSTIGALTYNRAAMGTFMARVRAAQAEVDSAVAARLFSEVRTAVNYQAIARLTSLQPLLDYSLASVHILGQRFEDALEPLARLLKEGPATSPLERTVVVQCDLALCLGKLGRAAEARSALELVGFDRLAECTPDDQVVAAAALAEAARACGMETTQVQAEATLSQARDDHRAAVGALRAALASFGEPALHQQL